MSFSEISVGSYWRPYELDAVKKYFGEQVSVSDSDVLFWRINTESLNVNTFNQLLEHEKSYKALNSKCKIVNPMGSYHYTDQKEECFKKWEEVGISCPKVFSYDTREDFESKRMDYPFLLRLNDRATGENTYLVENDSDFEKYFKKLEEDFSTLRRIGTKKICVEFIDTSIENGWKTSFRIHMAGNKVVSGYARVSQDWCAISNKFTEEMKDVFVTQNERVQTIISNNHDEIVRAVTSLGLHHQGLDVIADSNDKIYFLEVQPFYFSGRGPNHTNPTLPPFWNPYQPKILVDWLVKEKLDLYTKIPLYYDNWLDKKNHFDLCYKSLSEFINVRT